MIPRLVKALMVLQVGLFAVLVGYNNIVDYGSNLAFVQHVLAMDDVFPGNSLTGRAIADPSLQHLAYALIIATEIGSGALCVAGALVLVRARRSAAEFERRKALAAAGLAAAFTLWFFGFMVVGAEWFQMWQSAHWNGQPSAFRFTACIALVLILLMLPEREAAG
jgi:predicted small integral membrane protein